MSIVNVRSKNKIPQTALEYIQSSPYPFYLTGSRFFGHNLKNSDWDFFSDDSQARIDDLQTNGFRRVKNLLKRLDYIDTIQPIVQIWEKENVQVQLVKDVELKRRVQEFIRDMDLYKKLGMNHRLDSTVEASEINAAYKKMNRMIWNIATIIVTDMIKTIRDNAERRS